MNTEKFWMVIREQGKGSQSTSRRHETYEEAKKEAENLCIEERASFIVLEAMEICQTKGIPVVWSNMKEGNL